ncbi:MAG: UDP-N-acetylglucosamine 4,6-dehydratase [Spirochaetes bacterium]|nr:UDP-N-acetylglucosamine 4,6-dehydratase [Spirochaetota bacterium]
MFYFFDEDFILFLLKRKKKLFSNDLKNKEDYIKSIIENSSFLVIGGAGTIGSATVKEIFKRNPKVLHIIDISENNLAELVRDIRSSLGYINGDFRTFAIDVGTPIYDKLFHDSDGYDYILNFSALKHVRSERDPYTLMRMIDVNILNTIKTIELAIEKGVKKYFCVSTDKATNPVNLMGASKRIMELFLIKYSDKIKISTARFANVAFSDGSLLYGFIQRIMKKQPITTPDDVKRYFIIPSESGVLCLLNVLCGENKEIFFPKLDPINDMITFWDIAQNFLNKIGYDIYLCKNEDEARELAKILPDKGKWPCYISKTDTTGEKEFEEFYTNNDIIDLDRFDDIGVMKLNYSLDLTLIDEFLVEIDKIKNKKRIEKKEIVDLFKKVLPEFTHIEKEKYLDQKM